MFARRPSRIAVVRRRRNRSPNRWIAASSLWFGPIWAPLSTLNLLAKKTNSGFVFKLIWGYLMTLLWQLLVRRLNLKCGFHCHWVMFAADTKKKTVARLREIASAAESHNLLLVLICLYTFGPGIYQILKQLADTSLYEASDAIWPLNRPLYLCLPLLPIIITTLRNGALFCCHLEL